MERKLIGNTAEKLLEVMIRDYEDESGRQQTFYELPGRISLPTGDSAEVSYVTRDGSGRIIKACLEEDITMPLQTGRILVSGAPAFDELGRLNLNMENPINVRIKDMAKAKLTCFCGLAWLNAEARLTLLNGDKIPVREVDFFQSRWNERAYVSSAEVKGVALVHLKDVRGKTHRAFVTGQLKFNKAGQIVGQVRLAVPLITQTDDTIRIWRPSVRVDDNGVLIDV
ncbi:MAG: hypothetical protein LBQ83_07955 [Candidatus Margulisbacteria bacterium]|jgi:hypothetical protein|nr:hypothetical protein [Candidatus Margulisiibacteriota bacterium]